MTHQAQGMIAVWAVVVAACGTVILIAFKWIRDEWFPQEMFTCQTCGRTLPTRTLRFHTPRTGEMILVLRNEYKQCWIKRVWKRARRNE